MAVPTWENSYARTNSPEVCHIVTYFCRTVITVPYGAVYENIGEKFETKQDKPSI